MGFFDFLKKREGSNDSDHSLEPEEPCSTADDEYDPFAPIDVALHEEKRGPIEVLEPCGFNFDNVLVYQTRIVDVDTGEITRQKRWVRLDGANWEKTKAVVADLHNRMGRIEFLDHEWPSFIPFYNHTFCSKGPGKTDMGSIEANLLINEAAASGKPKRYPMQVQLSIKINERDIYLEDELVYFDCSTEAIIYADLLKDGSIGKAEVILWRRQREKTPNGSRPVSNAHRCLFTVVKGEVKPKKLMYQSTYDNAGWVTYFDSKHPDREIAKHPELD